MCNERNKQKISHYFGNFILAEYLHCYVVYDNMNNICSRQMAAQLDR